MVIGTLQFVTDDHPASPKVCAEMAAVRAHDTCNPVGAAEYHDSAVEEWPT
jgi:hypothetical protein